MRTKGPLHVEATGTTTASPTTVWALLEDAAAYHQWGPWRDSGYKRAGDDGAHGPGAIRWFRYGRTTTVERVLEVESGRRLAYDVVSGIPVRNYRAVVELTPAGTGTAVRWSATFDPTPGGRLVRRKLQSIYHEVMADLVRAGDKQGGERPSPASTV
jgi:uncharacterized protein YndB with AHSA1/START domain